jgi:hypothetical protein
VDDRAVVGDQRPRHCAAVPQAPREVVLDDERARCARHIEDLAASFGCQHGAGRVLEGRLAVQQPRRVATVVGDETEQLA